MWEFVYHLLQQFRWEKDWPTLFGLLVGIPEGLLAYAVARSGVLPAAENITPGPSLSGSAPPGS